MLNLDTMLPLTLVGIVLALVLYGWMVVWLT